MTFDRFAICDAYYVYATLWHGGQASKEYAYLGRLANIGYHPSSSVAQCELEHSAAVVYAKLVLDAGHVESGYSHCLCRDCFDISMDGGFCNECVDSECGMGMECKRDYPAGMFDE